MNPKHSVALLEYGHRAQDKHNALDDSIVINNLTNHHDPYECTNKGLGGTSLTWGGRCVMYDDVDFMQRPILGGNCTWEIGLFKEVKNFSKVASQYFECGDPLFTLKDIPEFSNKRISENFVEGIVTDSCVERWSMPTRFGDKYAAQIARTPNLKYIEGIEARNFIGDGKTGRIKCLVTRSSINGKESGVIAKNFVIAAGGQETTRILLRNKNVFNRLNFVPSALGRYYQGHVFGKIASVSFTGDPKRTEFGFLRNSDGTYIRRRFQFSRDHILEKQLLNTAIWLDNPLYYDPSHKNGAMSVMYLAMIAPFLGKKLAPPAIAHSITKGKATSIGKHFLNVMKDMPNSITVPAGIFYKRYCVKRKLPGIFLYNPNNTYALNFHSEQLPLFENRMELDSDGEKLKIFYQITDVDADSVVRAHDELDKWLRTHNTGAVHYWYEKSMLRRKVKEISRDGIHQIGTTRIAESPQQGVLDKNLKVYGTENLFVCSSSAFPTSGQANPTFLLGAFAVRLAKHLGGLGNNRVN